MTIEADEGEKSPVLIAGPTASGKTALAIDLAKKLDGVIFNADSMQVYMDLRILTARPTAEEEAEAPHLLFGHVPGDADYSVGAWLDDIGRELSRLEKTGKVPVIVGGTGLYFKALTEGLSEIPPVDPEIFETLKQQWETNSGAVLSAFAEKDPEMAERLEPADRQRTIRALAVLETTGQSIRHWQGRKGTPLLDPARCRKIILTPDRQWLYDRINRRFELMMEAGATEEVRTLLEKRLPLDRPVMKAIGVSQLREFLSGTISREETVERAQTASRQYAKRQMTWFRNQMDADWERIDNSAAP